MSIRAWLVRRKIRAAFRPNSLRNAPEDERLRHFDKTLQAMEPQMPGAPDDAVIETVNTDKVKGDWISVPGARPDRVLFYSHGGGYVWGQPKNYHDLGARLSRAMQAHVFLLDYRLAPEFRCPAPVEDAVAAYDYILEAKPGAAITMAGDSAGGGLTLATAQVLRDSDRPQPKALALISPWLDMTGSGDSVETNRDREVMLEADGIAVAGAMYRGELAPDDPRCSPLFGSQSGLPPMLVQVGSEEILLSDSTRLADRVKDAKGDIRLDIWKKMHHVWHLSAGIVPEGRKATSDMAAYFNEYWGN